MKGAEPALKLVGDPDLSARSLPRAPGWLPDEGKAEWRRRPAAADWSDSILSRADLSVLASYCAAFSQVQQCQRLLNEEGLVVEGKLGAKGHPAAQISTPCAVADAAVRRRARLDAGVAVEGGRGRQG